LATAARVKYPAALQRCKLDTPLPAAGFLIYTNWLLTNGFNIIIFLTVINISIIILTTTKEAYENGKI